jgi:hypothetical protein
MVNVTIDGVSHSLYLRGRGFQWHIGWTDRISWSDRGVLIPRVRPQLRQINILFNRRHYDNGLALGELCMVTLYE